MIYNHGNVYLLWTMRVHDKYEDISTIRRNSNSFYPFVDFIRSRSNVAAVFSNDSELYTRERVKYFDFNNRTC